MALYKIVGPLPVCGHEPGSTVGDDDLTGADVTHLIEAGHLEPTKAVKADPAPITQED